MALGRSGRAAATMIVRVGRDRKFVKFFNPTIQQNAFGTWRQQNFNVPR